MIEKHIVLEDIDPVMFYGVGNAHLQMLRALYPKLRIVARDNVLRILSDELQLAAFEESDCEMDINSCGGQGFVTHQGLYCHKVGAVLV